MKLTIEIEQETDGRWIAEIESLPGVIVYGNTVREALNRVSELLLEQLEDDQDNADADAVMATLEQDGVDSWEDLKAEVGL